MAMPQDEIRRMPLEERLRLVEDIWDTIYAQESELIVTEAQREELRHRLEAHRADPEAATDLQSVLARLRSR